MLPLADPYVRGSEIKVVEQQYLDLVDGELINYEQGVYSATYATAEIHFIGKAYFDL